MATRDVFSDDELTQLHPGHQRGRHLDHGVPRPGRHRPAARRAGHRRRGPGAHLARPPRERPLLRHPLRRRRRRARQARLRRLPAATRRHHHGAGPVSAGKPEIRLHRLRAHPGRVLHHSSSATGSGVRLHTVTTRQSRDMRYPPFGAHPLAFMMPLRSVRDRTLWEGCCATYCCATPFGTSVLSPRQDVVR
jgi:hypothetical protein